MWCRWRDHFSELLHGKQADGGRYVYIVAGDPREEGISKSEVHETLGEEIRKELFILRGACGEIEELSEELQLVEHAIAAVKACRRGPEIYTVEWLCV